MEMKAEVAVPTLPNGATYNLAAIDYARVILALLVISIHVAPLTSFSALANYGMQQYLARLAVPFFFFCNGFFLFKPGLAGKTLQQNVWRQLKKLFRLNVAWTVIYSPILVYNILNRDDSFLVECLRSVRGFLLTGSYTQLWYLPGAMLSIFLVWFVLDRKVSWKIIFSMGGILYAVGLCYDSWYGLVRALPIWDVQFVYLPVSLFLKAIRTTSNGLFFGFLFVALGAYSAQHPLPPLRTCQIGFTISMLVGFAETIIVVILEFRRNSGAAKYLFLPFAVTFLCCALLQLPAAGHPDTKRLRKISSLIFLIHMWFSFLYNTLSKHCDSLLPILENSLFRYSVVTVCSVLFAIFVLRLSEHRRFVWLKKCY